MSAFTRMMEDYDYHMNTGELPEYFGGGGGDNRGCGFGCFVAIILLAGLIYSTCCSEEKGSKQEPKPELVTIPANYHQKPYYPPEESAPISTKKELKELSSDGMTMVNTNSK